MRARVSNLCRTEAAWNNLNFIPLDGELIVYAPDENYNYARLKVGDGKTPLYLLPFFTDACIDAKLSAYQHASVSDAGHISTYFKDMSE